MIYFSEEVMHNKSMLIYMDFYQNDSLQNYHVN